MYKKYYNLTESPFQLNANIDFFYNSAGHKRAKAYLRYGLVQGEGFVVVTGNPGTGKTMLVKELFDSFKQDEDIITGLMVTSQISAEDTLRVLLSVFNITHDNSDNKAMLLLRLEEFFKENAVLGKRVLLVVDEAQNMPKQSIEELRMLSNFEWDGKVVFQVFLVGQEELGRLLYSSGMDQIKQRIVATYHLKAMAEAEVKEYIFFRLSKAGWDRSPEFEDDVFAEIFNNTGGVPRRINTLCDRLLLYGYLEELSVIDLDSTRHVINEIEADFYSLALENNNDTVVEKVVDTGDLSQEQRITALEQQITDLSNHLNKERALLRKAILIQLDMGDVYSEN